MIQHSMVNYLDKHYRNMKMCHVCYAFYVYLFDKIHTLFNRPFDYFRRNWPVLHRLTVYRTILCRNASSVVIYRRDWRCVDDKCLACTIGAAVFNKIDFFCCS